MTKYDLMRISSDFKRLCCERFHCKKDGLLACNSACPLRNEEEREIKVPKGRAFNVFENREETLYGLRKVNIITCAFFREGDKAVLKIAEEEAEDD